MATLRKMGMVRVAAFFGCDTRILEAGDPAHLAGLKARFDRSVNESGYSLVSSRMGLYSDLPTDGYSYDAHIGLSGLDIHTWPEYGSLQFVSITCADPSVCEAAFQKECAFLRSYLDTEDMEDCGTILVPIQGKALHEVRTGIVGAFGPAVRRVG